MSPIALVLEALARGGRPGSDPFDVDTRSSAWPKVLVVLASMGIESVSQILGFSGSDKATPAEARVDVVMEGGVAATSLSCAKDEITAL